MVTGITRPPLVGRLSWSLSLHSSVGGEPVKTPGPALAGVSKLCGGVSQAVMSSQGKKGSSPEETQPGTMGRNILWLGPRSSSSFVSRRLALWQVRKANPTHLL